MSESDADLERYWRARVEAWSERYGCSTLPPVDAARLEAAEAELGMRLHRELRALYRASNGLSCEWFRLVPIFDRADPKKTWDSLVRANRPETSPYLARRRELFGRFLVFAKLSGPQCALLDRSDGTLWIEDADAIHQTDLGLEEFIELSLKEASGRG